MARFPLVWVKLILSVALLMVGCVSRPITATPTGAPIHWSGHSRIELPLAFDWHGSPMVPARIMGKDVMALLDTGSSRPVLSPDFVAAVAMKVSNQGVVHDRVVVEYGPASQELEGAFVIKMPGDQELTAGWELFSQAVVEFDFDRGLVTLIRPDAFIPPVGKPLSVQFPSYWPTIQIRVSGQEAPICAIVDTGFGGGVALSRRTVDRLALPSIPGSSVRITTEGGRVQVAPALEPLKELGVGDKTYQDVPLAVGPLDDENQCSGFLGMEILSRHRVIFDLRSRRVWMLPRSEIKNSR